MKPQALPAAPAAERNKEPILTVLKRVLPRSGLVLEVASGLGQHAAHFARALPDLVWQPSDRDEDGLAVIGARVDAEGLSNLLPPLRLDAAEPAWPIARAEAIFNANMIHISPWEATVGLFQGASKLLPAGATLVTYGPYRFGGEDTAPSNVAFDRSLRERDPGWGVRDVDDLKEAADAHGLSLDEHVAMPANNFTLVWRRI